jgi:GMP synthase (glutamine-hydrolysing)
VDRQVAHRSVIGYALDVTASPARRAAHQTTRWSGAGHLAPGAGERAGSTHSMHRTTSEPVHQAADRPAFVIRHLAFEDLGSFEQVLLEEGYRITYLEAGVDDLLPAQQLNPELLIVLGGPIGANDERDYPFLGAELDLLASRMQADRPTLGICLGAQLMARAMGADVRAARRSEIGWAPLTLTPAGRASCLQALGAEPIMHWHGDMFSIPAGGVRLAATPDCPNQAFSLGLNQLALQFHAEVTVVGMERWYIGHANELRAADLSVARLRTATHRFGPGLETRGVRMLRQWLTQVQPRSAPSSPGTPPDASP